MTNHLSQEQIARGALGQLTGAERQHFVECPECRGQLELLDDALSLFQSSIRRRIDDRIALQPPEMTQFTNGLAGARSSKWRWALVAAATVVAVILPFVVSDTRPEKAVEQVSAQADADEIMKRMNLHLSRTVPAPMEPLLLVIPNEGSTTDPGGVQ